MRTLPGVLVRVTGFFGAALFGAALFGAALFGAALLAPPAVAQGAPTSSPAAAGGVQDTTVDGRAEKALARAQQLVGDGQSAAGRAIVDSVLIASPPLSARYATALFTRGALAVSAADAEGDYRRVAVEFPLSPRAPDALLRLAQLELARGDRAEALRHLTRLRTEYAGGAVSAQGEFWTARALFEVNDVPRGCAALLRARAVASPAEIEFRNQIDYELQRCAAIDTAAVVTRPLPAPAGRRVGTTREALSTGKSPAAAPTNTEHTGIFTVQVAATKTKAHAARIRSRIAARGYSARVVPATDARGAAFRVRVGHYATRRDAEAALRTMRRKGIGGFVTAAERP
ncbi:MAG: hypothetical protein NVS4B3_09830 [Gemmatimonadaceae bacterium]